MDVVRSLLAVLPVLGLSVLVHPLGKKPPPRKKERKKKHVYIHFSSHTPSRRTCSRRLLLRRPGDQGEEGRTNLEACRWRGPSGACLSACRPQEREA